MVISLGRIVGRRVFARSFPGGFRTYLTSSSQINGVKEGWTHLGNWIVVAVGTGIGGYIVHESPADIQARVEKEAEAKFQARCREFAESLAKELEETRAENKANEEALARLAE